MISVSARQLRVGVRCWTAMRQARVPYTSPVGPRSITSWCPPWTCSVLPGTCISFSSHWTCSVLPGMCICFCLCWTRFVPPGTCVCFSSVSLHKCHFISLILFHRNIFVKLKIFHNAPIFKVSTRNDFCTYQFKVNWVNWVHIFKWQYLIF